MTRILLSLSLVVLAALTAAVLCRDRPQEFAVHSSRSRLPVWHPDYATAKAVSYESEPEADELDGVQCPIPMKDRVKNYTGIQCVFSSIECIGRWAECPKLTDPPITSRAECKSYSSPEDAAKKLTSFGVKFEQSHRDREKSLALLKRAMADGRGCLWGVPGHAMVLVHYDETKKIVKYINNSNSKLPIETMSMERFNKTWDTWVLVVFSEPDPFPGKAGGFGNLSNLLPIVDRNNPQGSYDKKYIPIPQK